MNVQEQECGSIKKKIREQNCHIFLAIHTKLYGIFKNLITLNCLRETVLHHTIAIYFMAHPLNITMYQALVHDPASRNCLMIY